MDRGLSALYQTNELNQISQQSVDISANQFEPNSVGSQSTDNTLHGTRCSAQDRDRRLTIHKVSFFVTLTSDHSSWPLLRDKPHHPHPWRSRASLALGRHWKAQTVNANSLWYLSPLAASARRPALSVIICAREGGAKNRHYHFSISFVFYSSLSPLSFLFLGCVEWVKSAFVLLYTRHLKKQSPLRLSFLFWWFVFSNVNTCNSVLIFCFYYNYLQRRQARDILERTKVSWNNTSMFLCCWERPTLLPWATGNTVINFFCIWSRNHCY